MAPSSLASPSAKDEIVRIFNIIDTNGDGKISQDELSNMLNLLCSPPSDDEVKEAMKILDVDNDGYISLDEFMALELEAETTYVMKKVFEEYDEDNDGKISIYDLQKMLQRCGFGRNLSIDYCMKMITAFDVDGDGYINLEEFEMMMAAK